MEQFEKVPSNVQEIPGRGEETLQAARERLNETLAGVTKRTREAAQYADQTVQSHPWTSVGIGFGAGILIGALLAMVAASSRN